MAICHSPANCDSWRGRSAQVRALSHLSCNDVDEARPQGSVCWKPGPKCGEGERSVRVSSGDGYVTGMLW